MTQEKPQAKAPFQLYLLAALAAAGFALSLSLSYQYYQVRGGTAAFKSFCNLGEALNCDAVAASPFAEFLGGIPLSSMAGGWFLALAVLSLIALAPDWRKAAVKGAFGLTLVGTLASVFYFVVMAAVIKTYCIFCIGVDVVNLLALGTVLSLKPFSGGKVPFGRWKNMGFVTLGAIIVSFVIGKSMDTLTADKTTILQMADSVTQAAPVPVSLNDAYPYLGSKDAPITIVEFSDFQCPYCRIGAMTLNSVLNRYPGKIRVVFRNFPLDPTCNPLIQHAGHSAACESAKVALCANRQGKFREVYEELFEKQSSLGPGRPTELAKQKGVAADVLAGCVAGPETVSAIAKDIEEGKQLGVQSTPTFFINGRKVEGAYPVPVWYLVIDRMLESQSKP